MTGMMYPIELPITENGEIRLPKIVRERHFIEDYDLQRAIVQPIGRKLQITIWSPKDLVEISLPLEEWFARKPFGRSLKTGDISITAWEDKLDIDSSGDENTITGLVSSYSTDWQVKHPENI